MNDVTSIAPTVYIALDERPDAFREGTPIKEDDKGHVKVSTCYGYHA